VDRFSYHPKVCSDSHNYAINISTFLQFKTKIKYIWETNKNNNVVSMRFNMEILSFPENSINVGIRC
jgi:hypothetical protein